MRIKLISFVLALVLLFTQIPISASAEKRPNLTFRNIEFGTIYNEVIERLKKDIGENIYISEQHNMYNNQNIHDVFIRPKGNEEFKVAGYDLENIELFFCNIDYTGKKENSVLVAAVYNFVDIDNQGQYEVAEKNYDILNEDLQNKLSNLYGESIYVTGKEEIKWDYVDKYDVYCWIGFGDNPEPNKIKDEFSEIFKKNIESIYYEDKYKYLDEYIRMTVRCRSKALDHSLTNTQLSFYIYYASIEEMRKAEELRLESTTQLINIDKNNSSGL